MKNDMKIKLVQCEHHRNGVCGLGFYAILFDWKDGKTTRRMVATLFDEPGACAVLEVAPLSIEVGVTFGENSWRGDDFEKELRRLAEESEKP
jgi:hypothetical protein